MKESATIALSYVRAHATDLDIPPGAFKQRRFHVHVPAGAVPKDGPSAGVTMTTALVSLLTGRPVRSTVGMTGEVTLQGKVLPIGGVKQKVLAAHRAGLDVVLPARNEADLDDVPEAVLEDITVHLASDIGEVLAVALEDDTAAPQAARAALLPLRSGYDHPRLAAVAYPEPGIGRLSSLIDPPGASSQRREPPHLARYGQRRSSPRSRRRAPPDRQAQAGAAGVAGVLESLRHVRSETGLGRGARMLLKVNQPDGFDCPACAWPEPNECGHLEFCENGAKAVAEEATLRRVDAEFFAANPVSELAQRSDHWLGKQGRLTSPMHKPAGEDHYRPVSWDDAFRLVADELRRSGDPDRAIFYTSGRTSNEAAFAYQLLVRAYGTNNLPDCSNMCHESSAVALAETIGVGKGVTLEDIHEAQLLVVVGQNPGTNHPRMLTALEEAKSRGARIIAINPMPEAGLMR